MLILTSNGLSTSELLKSSSPYIANKRCALITTASVGYKANDRHVPRLTQELLACGAATVDLFDFDEQTPEALLSYDCALLIGGNPFYLLSSIREHGFADALNIFSQQKTLIGVSAGSLVLTPSISILNEYTPELNDAVHLADLTGLSLYPHEILPHYTKFLARFDCFEEKARAYERTHGLLLRRLNDGEAIFY